MEARGSTGQFLSIYSTIPAWGTEITTTNGSDYTGTWACHTETVVLRFLTFLLALIGLPGNAIVLWLLGFCMHRNDFSVYILNLAGADFLFLCFPIIYFLKYVIYLSHSIHLSIPKFFYVVYNFAYLAGLGMLSAISTERCLSVLWPIWYRCHRPRHTSAVVCTLLWVLSLMMSFLKGDGCGRLHNVYDYDKCQIFNLLTTVWVIVLFVVLSGSSLGLLVRIFCGSRRVPVTRLYVTIVLTVLVFLFFGLPFGIYWFLIKWINTFDYVTPCRPYLLTISLSCVNSCANPIIYFFVGYIKHPRFQWRTFKLLLQRAMQDTPEEGGCGDRGASGNGRQLETVWSSS